MENNHQFQKQQQFSEEQDHHYRLLEKQGEGTFGTVYKAVDQRTDTIVALKKIKIRKADDGLPREFLREVESLKLLQTQTQQQQAQDQNYGNIDNIIEIREVFVGKTSINIVYPFIKRDLSKVIQDIQRPFTNDEIRAITRQILNGLNFIHSNQLMHRDLKPANILITDDGIVKIIDFGQARVIDKNQELGLTYTLDIGTKWYKAPEIFMGNKKYNEKIDMWSMGCVIAELVDGCVLFPGLSDIDQIARIMKVCGNYVENDLHQDINLNILIYFLFIFFIVYFQEQCNLNQKFIVVNEGQKLKFTNNERINYNVLLKYFGNRINNPELIDLIDNLLVHNIDSRLSASEALSHAFYKQQNKNNQSDQQIVAELLYELYQ